LRRSVMPWLGVDEFDVIRLVNHHTTVVWL
jgi:hypothetical protein